MNFKSPEGSPSLRIVPFLNYRTCRTEEASNQQTVKPYDEIINKVRGTDIVLVGPRWVDCSVPLGISISEQWEIIQWAHDPNLKRLKRRLIGCEGKERKPIIHNFMAAQDRFLLLGSLGFSLDQFGKALGRGHLVSSNDGVGNYRYIQSSLIEEVFLVRTERVRTRALLPASRFLSEGIMFAGDRYFLEEHLRGR